MYKTLSNSNTNYGGGRRGYTFKMVLSTWIFIFVIYRFFYFYEVEANVGACCFCCHNHLIAFFYRCFYQLFIAPNCGGIASQGMKRWLSVTIIYLLFFGGTGYGLYKGIPAMINQIQELSENAPSLIKQYKTWVEMLHHQTSNWPFGFQERIEKGLDEFEVRMNDYLNNVGNYATMIFDFLILFALIPFIAFYMLKDYEELKKVIVVYDTKKWRNQGRAFLRDVDTSLGGYIRGLLLICGLMGVIAALLFWMFGMKYPLVFGIIIGITNVIPYFGPIIGAIPAIIIAATMSMKMVLTVAIIVVVLQFLEGNILSPIIVGKSLHMHL